MAGETRVIPVDELHLHLRNPRCLFTSTEEDALYELFADQGGNRHSNKLLVLARDIAENGLSSTDLIMVEPTESGFTVREGNRRIAAIKCALHPDIIPGDFEFLKKGFSILGGSMPDVINCYVTDDENEINRLIGLKHNGQRGGMGTIPWNSEQRSRFDQVLSGRPDKIVGLIDFLVQYYGKDSDEARYIAGCKKTNLERMFNNRYVREKLGFNLTDSAFIYVKKNDALLSLFLKRLSEAKVGEIYYAGDRRVFVDHIVSELMGPSSVEEPEQQLLPKEELDLGIAEDNGSAGIEQSDLFIPVDNVERNECADFKDSNPRPRGHQRHRKTVAPQYGSPLHTEGKPHLYQLHCELKTLSVQVTPMACGLVFRALIEQVVDWYLAATGSGESCGSRYSGRIQAACNALVKDEASGIENNDVDYLRKFAQNKDSMPVTLSSLNSIAHGSAGYPDPESLIVLWDKTYYPLRAMLDYGRKTT